MRPLTQSEREISTASRKRANRKRANRKLAEIRAQLRATRRADLRKKTERMRNINGLPVKVMLDGESVTLDYQLLRRLVRTLKRRSYEVRISVHPTGVPALHIRHWGGVNHGRFELRNLPDYQINALDDLPVIQLDPL